MENVYAIILAAGDSSRFGTTKQLQPLNGKTLLQRVQSIAQDVFHDRVLVILGSDHKSIETSLQDHPVKIIHNPDWPEGMASSIRAGIRALPASCNAVLILLSDQPQLETSSLTRLLETWQQHPDCIITSAYNDTFGVPAIFPAAYFDALLTLQGDRGAKPLMQAQKDNVITVPVPEAGIDIDTPRDLEKLNEPRRYQEPTP